MRELPSLVAWLPTLAPSEIYTLAQLWGVEPGPPERLLEQLTDPAAVARLLGQLRLDDRSALERVLAAGGRLAAGALEREWGAVRQHTGFVNPRAYLHALSGVASPVERLFVLGLLQRERGPSEAEYAVPSEWLALLPAVEPQAAEFQLEPIAAPRQRQAGDPLLFERDLVALLELAYCAPLALNHNGTLQRAALARLSERLLEPGVAPGSEKAWPEAALLRLAALKLGLLAERQGVLRVAGEAVQWLGLPPAERLRRLLDAWLESPWDELAALCGLRWKTPPLHRPGRRARRALLELLREQAPEGWFSIAGLTAEARRVAPDLLRSGAEYDSWQLASPEGEPLVGFANWQRVEGCWLAALLAGPLHWLGLIDLGGAGEPTAARLSAWGRALLGLAPPPPVAEGALRLSAKGLFEVPDDAPPLARFQLSRIAAWQGRGAAGERYRITARSFDEALERGIGRPEIERFVRQQIGDAEKPPGVADLARQLSEWEQRRSALAARPMVLLEASRRDLLASIAADPALRLPERIELTPEHWAFEPGDGPALLAALRDRGYGLSAALEAPDTPLGERDLAALLTAALACSALAERQGADAGLSAALLERVRRLLPAAARAQAERAARDLAADLGCPPAED